MVKVIAHTGSKCIYGIIRLDAKHQIACRLYTCNWLWGQGTTNENAKKCFMMDGQAWVTESFEGFND